MSISNSSINDLKAAQILMVSSTNHQSNHHEYHPSDRHQANHQVDIPIDQPAKETTPNNPPLTSTIQIDQVSIHINDLIKRFQELDVEMTSLNEAKHQSLTAKSKSIITLYDSSQTEKSASLSQNDTTIFIQNKVELELSFSPAQKVDGFIVHNKNEAESDRYIFLFNNDGNDFAIVDKLSKHSTQIIGVPHLGLNNGNGEGNDEFSGLNLPNFHITLILMDGTRITIAIIENSKIDGVDLINGNQHITATGQASSKWPLSGLFTAKVVADGFTSDTNIPRGETVFAGEK